MQNQKAFTAFVLQLPLLPRPRYQRVNGILEALFPPHPLVNEKSGQGLGGQSLSLKSKGRGLRVSMSQRGRGSPSGDDERVVHDNRSVTHSRPRVVSECRLRVILSLFAVTVILSVHPTHTSTCTEKRVRLPAHVIPVQSLAQDQQPSIRQSTEPFPRLWS